MKQSRINDTKNINNEAPTFNCIIQKLVITSVITFLGIVLCPTIAKRIVCMILLANGMPHQRIAELTDVSCKTVSFINKEIISGNYENLFTIKGGGRKSKCDGFEQEIVDEIEAGSFRCAKQIKEMILKKVGIKTSESGVRRLLQKFGIKRLKCGSLPAKADVEEQRTFYDTILRPAMDMARSGEISLLFMDAAHFVFGFDYIGYIYGRIRRYITTFSGRKRYNVLGALDMVSKKMTTVTNTMYVSATEVCELLKKISVEYMGTTVYLILDNARYQKCKLVQNLANELGIQLLFIPPYSPNLNLIERFWKHVKGKLRTQSFDNFSEFCEYIDLISKCSDSDDKQALDTLISEKVQLFDDLKPINEHTFISKNDEAKAANLR